jgi:hypothetical protein
LVNIELLEDRRRRGMGIIRCHRNGTAKGNGINEELKQIQLSSGEKMTKIAESEEREFRRFVIKRGFGHETIRTTHK